jgi:hypothetical protein
MCQFLQIFKRIRGKSAWFFYVLVVGFIEIIQFIINFKQTLTGNKFE